MASDLEHIQRRLEWATEQLPFVETKIQLFMEVEPYTIWAENDEQRGGALYKIKYTSPVPDDILIELSNIVHQIRSSLDQLACVLAVRNGSTNTKGVYFPICKSIDAFTCGSSSGRKKISKLSSGDQKKIEGLQPYMTANHALLDLHAMSLVDKHNRPINIQGYLASVGFNNGYGPFELSDAAWGALDNERTLCWLGPESNYELQVSVQVCFAEVGGMESKPVLSVLGGIISHSKLIIDKFR